MCLRTHVAFSKASEKTFVPDVYITEQTEQDKILRERVSKLFFEPENDREKERRKVYSKAVREYGAQEVMLQTDDDYRISTLYFKRPGAKLNIIYVPGFFHDETPPKEWCVPFAEIFPEHNIIAFDWRGFWDSEGESAFLEKGDFGTRAYPDIQAVIDFVKKENDYPIVLHGFCFGAAMAILATLESKKTGKPTVDAIGISSIFDTFENMFNRAAELEKRWFYWALLKSGIGKSILNYMTNGSLFDVEIINLIDQIDIPCWFDHWTLDPAAELERGISVFQAKTKGFKMFVQSDIGRHARIHAKAPYQYREAYNEFLSRAGLLK